MRQTASLLIKTNWLGKLNQALPIIFATVSKVLCEDVLVQHFSIRQMTFNPLLKEDPHLVVFKKANKHCNPAASVCKPNPQGTACVKSFCRHPSILLPFHHTAQSLHPVSSLRKYMRQLRPDYDVISKNTGGLTLPCFYYSAHIICCLLYQPVKKHSASHTRFYHFQPVQNSECPSSRQTLHDLISDTLICKLMKCY